MLVALVLLLWRRSRFAAVPLSLALVVLLVGSSGWMGDVIVRSLESQHLPAPNLPKVDAIVVLGGCTQPQLAPRSWVEIMDEGDRLIHAARLYQAGNAPRVILSGGRIDWAGGGGSEAADMAQMMQFFGVPYSAILRDDTSLNTYENAVNVKQIMDAQGIKRILLVTSAFHMPRSLLIFKKLGIEAIAAPTDFVATSGEAQALQASPESTTLNLLPDAYRLEKTTKALKEYVGMAVYRLRGWL